MKTVMRLVAVVSVLAVLSIVSSVSAQDWPQWRGVNRDGRVTDFKAPAKWPQELTRKWEVTVGAGDATPALVDGKLYVFTRQGDEEIIRCMDAGSGKVLWANKYTAQSVTGPATSHPGPRSSPTVANGRVVTMGVTGILSCLDRNSGKVLWRKEEFANTVPQFYVGMSPAIVDNKCIAHFGGPDAGEIIAFEIDSGKEVWRWNGDGPAYGSPVLVEIDGVRQLVTQTLNNIVSIALTDGALLWQIPTPAQKRFFNSATPIVNGRIVIFSGQGEGTKAFTFQKQGTGFTVQALWSNAELGTGYNTPVLKNGLLYGLSDRGRLYCMNAKTGETVWADETSHKNFGSILDAGSVILALPSDPELIAFTPSGEGYNELARIKIAETPVYAHPVIAGNMIYVKDEEKLTLWAIE
ncbi:PQQ-binding-like beta-propeller repeat protein [Candidatus Latescibacterota bacterium]